MEANQSGLGSTSRSNDDLDALIPSPGDGQRTKAAVEHVLAKIGRTKELIKSEQTARDENVNEYLKLAANADKNQLPRLKSVFEKKNQKSAQTIAGLQKKLEIYAKKTRDLEQFGWQATHHKPRDMLRDVGHGLRGVGTNIKEGITGLSDGVIGTLKSGLAATHTAGEAVIAKPKELLFRNKNRSNSADNIDNPEKNPGDESGVHVSQEGDSNDCSTSKLYHGSSTFTHSHSHSTKYTSDDESSSITSGSGHVGGAIASAGNSSTSPGRYHLYHSNQVAITETAATPTAMIDLEPVLSEIRDRREECQRLSDEVDSLKTQLQNECSLFHQNLQEERYRFERLEEQMNDLIELHQNEIENLKQGIADMEEKVQYQSEERLRDVHEMLESCQTRISRMEHQQLQHLQQLVNLDSLENSNARALVLKLINVVLTVLQVILLLVATIANILTPFLKTRVRILTTIILILLIVLLWQQRPDMASYVRTRLSDRFPNLVSFVFHEKG